MDNCVGIILAGGKSRRMGKDKSMLDFMGITLTQRIINEHKKLVDKVYVVGKATDNFDDALGIEDKIANKGPVGGLYTALSEIESKWYLISPCDMPFLNFKHLNKLLHYENQDKYKAIIAESDNGYEPLVALYNRDIFYFLRENIQRGEYAVRALFNKINKKFIKYDSQIFEKDVFFNINYPIDYNKALKIENKINSK